jgi:hypothetical protein
MDTRCRRALTISGTDDTALALEKNAKLPAERFDYDNLWKTVLHRYFWEALELFLPDLYEAADKSREPEFLEQELQKITLDLEGGLNRTDLLVKIALKNGAEEIVLCHMEIQGEGGENLATRMYRYKQMIFLRYAREPVGIAILTASRPKNEKTFYCSEQFGVKVLYRYVNGSVMDMDDASLLSGKKCVGLLLYAQKCARKSGEDEGLKFRYLKEISTLWARHGWSAEDKRILLLAVNYLLNLKDEDYSRQIVTHVKTLVESLKEEEKVMYTSVFERVYKEEGRIEGRMEGRVEGRMAGRVEGRAEERAELVRVMLSEGMPVEEVSRYTKLPREEVTGFLNRQKM